MKRRDAILKPLKLAGLKRVFSRAASSVEEPRTRTIGRILVDYISRVTEGRFRRMVTRVLALTPRGFVPHDVLVLSKLSAQLQVEWRSRDVHPWDRDLPWERRAELFRDQTMRDTNAVIMRLFRMLPDVDAIEIRVLDPRPPNLLILAGTVVRQDALAARSLSSPGMTLRLMGIRYHMNNGRLEPLE